MSALDLMTNVVLTCPILVSRKQSSLSQPGMIRIEGETQLNTLWTHWDAGLGTCPGLQAVGLIN
eukprot:3935625-Rhodomonas_salina.1